MHRNSQWHIFPLFHRQSGLGKRMIQGQGLKKQKASISLSPSNIAGWIQTAPEAELSRALSCDRTVITSWINTCVVKVKWCYVVRCYWTWRVTLHDTDTLPSAPSSSLCCRLGWGGGSREAGQVLWWSPSWPHRLVPAAVYRSTECSLTVSQWHTFIYTKWNVSPSKLYLTLNYTQIFVHNFP